MVKRLFSCLRKIMVFQKMAKKARDLGIGVEFPENKCEGDKHCPFHGKLVLRGRVFTGKVVRAKVPKNALVEWNWPKYISKYERYEKRRTRLMAHNPECISAAEGDIVKIAECRKISKTKNFVIVQIISKNQDNVVLEKNNQKSGNSASDKGNEKKNEPKDKSAESSLSGKQKGSKEMARSGGTEDTKAIEDTKEDTEKGTVKSAKKK